MWGRSIQERSAQVEKEEEGSKIHRLAQQSHEREEMTKLLDKDEQDWMARTTLEMELLDKKSRRHKEGRKIMRIDPRGNAIRRGN